MKKRAENGSAEEIRVRKNGTSSSGVRGTRAATKPAKAGSPEPSPEERLRQIQAKILRSMEAITDAVIAQARKGKYTDARFLFELAGVKTIALAEKVEKTGGESLCEALLRRLAKLPTPESNDPAEEKEEVI